MSTDTLTLLDAAKRGDRPAFDRIFAEHVPKLRGLLRRLVGHPDDVDELAQQALLNAYEGIASFRGEANPGTWLCSIGARLAIDHLRSRKRWRERAQSIFAAEALSSPELGTEIGEAFSDPEFSYDVNEHIAYCFTCLGRSLAPEAQAALVLRDVIGLSNEEAARALKLSHSVFRHQLAAARKGMQQSFEGLCALVSKQGVCWQCSGLRAAVAEDKRGSPPPATLDWPRRLQVVRDAPLGEGCSKLMHDLFFRRTEEQEEQRRGQADATTDCGREP
jgi:RNA polymerase sigma-70 factor (ECF subfamily)